MLKIWGRNNSINVQKAMWCVGELGLEHERIDTGGVCVNDMTLTYGVPEAPFGGRKASGVGQINGPHGIRGYCHAQPIIADRKGKGDIQGGYPYTRKDEDGMQKFIRFLWGKTPVGRWLS